MRPIDITPYPICRIFIAFVAVLLLGGCKDHSTDVETFLPKPAWVDSIDAPILNTVEDVSTLWQSKKRCCVNKWTLQNNQREFYKACYVAVATHSQDQLLVAKCLQLMDNGMERDVRYQIHQHYLDKYFYLKSLVDRCFNCSPADPLVNVVLNLAWIENYNDNPQRAIDIVQRVLDERIEEISPYRQMSLYEVLARFYRKTGYSAEQLIVLKAARDRLRDHKDENRAATYNFKTLEKHLSDLLEG